MMVILDLKSSRLSCEMSRPSKIIFPSAASRILSRHIMMVDFPEPVLPTTPILWPPVKVTLRPLNTRSRFSLYLHLKSIKSILPLSGQVSLLANLLSIDLIFSSSLFLRYWTYPLYGTRSIKDSHRSIEMSSLSNAPILLNKKYMTSSKPRDTTKRSAPLEAC